MVKRYAKGSRGERELVHELAKRGFVAIRTPRSGRIGLPSPDIVAMKNGRVIVIECKSRRRGFRVPAEQISELIAWEHNGARAYVGWKISRKGWVFLTLNDVIESRGNVGKELIGRRGIGIDALEGHDAKTV